MSRRPEVGAGAGRGFFVSFEGPEGSGKTTQIVRLSAALEAAGFGCVSTREPGGTPVGERIRGLLLDLDGGPLQPETELLLFCAARRELLASVIRPALESGRIVLCDRYADATRAYQGQGRGLDPARIEAVNRLATDGLEPDLTLLLDLPVARGLARRQAVGETWNRFDAASLAFHERVRGGYLALAEARPERIRVIDADQDAEQVFAAAWRALSEALDRAGLSKGPSQQ
ncbi:MAG: dTMP kinase [Chloroflexi bacterium]|nr:dTMP kinase [Chloroflexota bacterium]